MIEREFRNEIMLKTPISAKYFRNEAPSQLPVIELLTNNSARAAQQTNPLEQKATPRYFCTCSSPKAL